MRFRFPIFCTGLALIIGASACLAGRCPESGLAKYIAGVELLNNSPTLSNSEKAAYYRRLVALTGMDAQCAAILIGACRNRPEKWDKIHKAIQATLEQPDTLKKE
jgi:hypothetical protein